MFSWLLTTDHPVGNKDVMEVVMENFASGEITWDDLKDLDPAKT